MLDIFFVVLATSSKYPPPPYTHFQWQKVFHFFDVLQWMERIPIEMKSISSFCPYKVRET